MTGVKAREPYDEPVTKAVLDRAVAEGRQRQGAGLHAETVRYLSEFGAVLIGFADRSALALPVANYPELAELSPAELSQLEIGFGGSALCFDARDLHVSIAGLVSASQPLMELAATVVAIRNGGRKSTAKAQASRSNGTKGGRPRKLATAV
jgi:hypothetical protein